MLSWALLVDALGWNFFVDKPPRRDKVSFSDGVMILHASLLCVLYLLRQVVNFLKWKLNNVNLMLMFMFNERNHSICYTTATYEVHAFKKKIKENH